MEEEKKLPDNTNDLGTTAKNPMELLLCFPEQEEKNLWKISPDSKGEAASVLFLYL